MSVAERLDPSPPELLSWAQIRANHPDEWVCLVDVEDAADGSLSRARVLGHGCSVLDLEDELGLPLPNTVLIHTEGRRLLMPRIVMTDEVRELLQTDP